MRKQNVGMAVFVIGMFVTMSAVGGMEQTPGYLLEQCVAAVVGIAVMFAGVTVIRDSE